VSTASINQPLHALTRNEITPPAPSAVPSACSRLGRARPAAELASRGGSSVATTTANHGIAAHDDSLLT
jgi:hypothetical protein